jgi:ATP-dependent 26S proteasome regulatory subunit
MISAVIKFDDNRVSIHSSTTKAVGTTFDKGFYIANFDGHGNLVIYEEFLQELHNPYRTKENENIIETVNGFFSEGIEEKVKSLGFIHKLGILTHGKQGTGKTSLLHFVAKKLLEEQNAIVLFCNSSSFLSGGIALAKMIREIQSNPIVFIADEFERYAKDAESEMKNFLDGNTSINNMLFLAATNYIDKVPDTLKDRPSRFKIVQEIKGLTDKTIIKQIITDISNKIQPNLFTSYEIDEAIKDVDDITLDEIKHLCLNKITNSYIPKQVLRREIGFKAFKKEDEKENEKVNIAYPYFTIGFGPSTVPEPSDTNI